MARLISSRGVVIKRQHQGQQCGDSDKWASKRALVVICMSQSSCSPWPLSEKLQAICFPPARLYHSKEASCQRKRCGGGELNLTPASLPASLSLSLSRGPFNKLLV